MGAIQIGESLDPDEKTSNDFNRLMNCSFEKLDRIYSGMAKAGPDFWRSFERETTCAMIAAESELSLNWKIDYKENSHRFPDIVAQINKDRSIGVEIKTIGSDKKGWKTLGGSILESTKMPGLERIHVLCAKQPPAFSIVIRPFEDCVSSVQVTHSPRYVLDLEQKAEESLFVKIDKSYQEICSMTNPFDAFRGYLLQQKRVHSDNDKENYWWCPKDLLNAEDVSEQELANNFVNSQLRFWRDLYPNERHYLTLEMFVRFPEVVFGDYSEAARWLLTKYFIINPSFRDVFSAGGKVEVANPSQKKMEKVPRIIGFLIENKAELIHHFNASLLERWEKFFISFSSKKKNFDVFTVRLCLQTLSEIARSLRE